MNVLVTGSNGFIGNHVIKYFRDKGEYVIGLGRSSEPADADRVDEYVSCDMGTGRVSEIMDLIKADHIDAVVHLAADMRKEPYNTEVVINNCGGTQRILEFCEKNDIGIFAQLSSLPVIGHPVEHPVTEDHPLEPYTVYHITKHCEEMLADYAFRYRGIRTSSFRISAPIGPGVNPATIFPTFIRKALNGDDLVLSGKGTRRQNYVHAEDIAQALYKAVYSDRCHGVYNLTGDLLVSNRQLAEDVIALLGSDSKIVFSGQDDPMDDYVWDASLEKIKRDTGYMPLRKMDDAILEYAKWLQSR
ncbi:MAG: NAD(P)-dependent oxidoreductase [Lachnospiraceae bacterium]|nr:NAD(P)-dependent oxidoreductase [Lachnospiraceae bacterium]